MKPPPSYQPEDMCDQIPPLAQHQKLPGCERTVLLHDRQIFDDDLGAGSDQDLTLASLLGIVDGLERIVQDGGFDHIGGCFRSMRFSSSCEGEELEVSAVGKLVSSSLEHGRVPNEGFFSSCRKR